MIKITHKFGAGFFSHCTARLIAIKRFINTKKKLPEIVDSSALFPNYKNQKKKRCYV